MTQFTSWSCDEFADSLADFLERDLAEPRRASMESHALSCAECGSLLADLRKLRMDAANLPVLTPSRDLWSGIAGRIDAPVIPLNAGRGATVIASGPGQRNRERIRRTSVMVAAAAALIAVTSGVTYFATMRLVGHDASIAVASAPISAPPSIAPAVASAVPESSAPAEARATTAESAVPQRDVQRVPAGPGASAGVNATLASNPAVKAKLPAEVTYDREITRLRAIVQQRRSQLDPATVSIIERNLKVIDDAIAQCRSALAKDPASRFLMESLNNALETKLELMRTAAMLPSRT
jgi:hypothetical protein